MANRLSQTKMQAREKARIPSRGGTPQVQPGQIPNQRQVSLAPMGSTSLGLGAAPSNQMLQPSPAGLNLEALAKYRAGPQPDSDNMMGRGGNGMTFSQNMGKLGFTGMGGAPAAPMGGAPAVPTGMKKGGKVSSASSRGDGCAQRGKTKGKFI